MQAELRAQHEVDLDGFHLAVKHQNRPKSRRQVQSLSSTGENDPRMKRIPVENGDNVFFLDR